MNRECVAELSCQSSSGDSWVIRLLAPLEEDGVKPWQLVVEQGGVYTAATTRRRTLSSGYVSQLLRQLARKRIPAVFEYVAGCDGAHFELTLTRGFNHTTYHWWTELPAGFEPLMHFCNELMKAGRVHGAVSMRDNTVDQ